MGTRDRAALEGTVRAERVAEWDDILARLAPLPVKDGLYVALGSDPDTFDNLDSRRDHPTMLAPLGLLPGEGVDAETMRRTLHAVLERWDFAAKIWGWDYPMIAMTAARLGEPEIAVEILLRNGPNNAYLNNGHCPQRSDVVRRPGEGPGRSEIPAYLPANGALLAAVAMMAAGWDGAPADRPARASRATAGRSVTRACARCPEVTCGPPLRTRRGSRCRGTCPRRGGRTCRRS